MGEKEKRNKEADPPDNASLYRFICQQKIPAMSEGFINVYFSWLSYHITRTAHHAANLRKGSSQLLPVWPK
jgi:hypothetical protein